MPLGEPQVWYYNAILFKYSFHWIFCEIVAMCQHKKYYKANWWVGMDDKGYSAVSQYCYTKSWWNILMFWLLQLFLQINIDGNLI